MYLVSLCPMAQTNREENESVWFLQHSLIPPTVSDQSFIQKAGSEFSLARRQESLFLPVFFGCWDFNKALCSASMMHRNPTYYSVQEAVNHVLLKFLLHPSYLHMPGHFRLVLKSEVPQVPLVLFFTSDLYLVIH
jgi:hypothetical protein